MVARPDFTSLDRDPNDVEDFAVTIFYETADGEKEQVVRIDTAHGQVHMDKEYSEREDIKEFFNSMSFMEACTYLQKNWKKLLRRKVTKFGVTLNQ